MSLILIGLTALILLVSFIAIVVLMAQLIQMLVHPKRQDYIMSHKTDTDRCRIVDSKQIGEIERVARKEFLNLIKNSASKDWIPTEDAQKRWWPHA